MLCRQSTWFPIHLACSLLGLPRQGDGPAGGEVMALALGTVLQGRYRIEGSAGQGGMSGGYRAADLRLNAFVAIKRRLGSDGSLGEAFAREARLLATLRHPVLPKVTDYFLEDGG